MTRLSSWLWCLCASLLLMGQAHAATRFLLAVGAREGLADEEPLRFADSDAERVAEAFVDVGQVAQGRVQLLIDADAQSLDLALARLQGQTEEAARQGERVEVLFYASSHGDAQALHLRGDRYLLSTLQARLKTLPATTTLMMIDACRTPRVSRLGDRDKGATLGPRFDVNLAREIAPGGFVALYAARHGEAAQESDTLEGAFFTHHLVVGLRGAADFDRDGKITLAEAWRHAQAATLSGSHQTSSTQHPEANMVLVGEGEWVLSDLQRTQATLVLPAALDGHLLIVDARQGRVLLEVDKAKGRLITLALPARRVRVQLRPRLLPTQVKLGELSLEWGGTVVLNENDLDTRTLVATTQKGGIDVSPYLVSATAGVWLSPLFAPGTSAEVVAMRRLWSSPAFVRLRLQGVHGEVNSIIDDVAWHYRHIAVSGAVGAEGELWLGPVRGAVGVDVGALWLQQEGARLDNNELVRARTKPQTVSGWAWAPLLGLDVSVAVPIGFGLFGVGRGRAHAFALPIHGELTPQLGLEGHAGVAYEF